MHIGPTAIKISIQRCHKIDSLLNKMHCIDIIQVEIIAKIRSNHFVM